MKCLAVIFGVILWCFSSVSFAGTASFESTHVYSGHRVYDSCFTMAEGYYLFMVAIMAPGDYDPHPVRVQWDSEERILSQMSGWNDRCNYEDQYLFAAGFGNPGPEWEGKTYTFTVDCDDSVVSTVNIPGDTFDQLPVPVEVTSTGGMTPSASWTAVDGADSYAVRLFPLDADGNPDTSILIYDSGRLFTTSHPLVNPDTIAPGCYALCIESWDYPEDKMLNRSRYFTRISIGDSAGASFESTHVYSGHRVYDSCFTMAEGYYLFMVAIMAPGDYDPHPVRVQWDSEERILSQMSGWNDRCNYEDQYLFAAGFGNPGPEWEGKTYTFTVDCDDSVVSTVNIPGDTFDQLPVPVEVTSTGGMTPSASWTAVDGADSYAVRLFPLDADGNPDTSILIYDSGRLFTTSHPLVNPDTIAPGCYALCIESWDYPEDKMLNRSRYFTRISIESQAGNLADFNGDGDVDGIDLQLFCVDYQVNANSSCPDGCLSDINGDQQVNQEDVILFADQYGESIW